MLLTPLRLLANDEDIPKIVALASREDLEAFAPLHDQRPISLN